MTSNISGFRGKFVAVKTAKRRKTSSKEWLARQLNDPYVAKAKLDGYRSRSAYKLLEIHEKFNLLKPGMKLVDLGAAPGGWSQVAAKIIKSNDSRIVNSGKLGSRSDGATPTNMIIAVDLLEIEPIVGVDCLQKDFYAEDTEETIIKMLDGKADIVMSDMAANTTGHATTDHIRTLDLCEYALDFALKVLKPGGHFIAKIFRGGTENSALNRIKLNFHKVKHFKPSSSRKESVEIYLIALSRKSV
ncbi:RlmE family RNA methyltransferase [Rickettsia endosymbiont of Culicoides newsteadi]|uniref:RlmE family RNA methyltransferase n=1 Tax=Rickettsia endosymbiont of Culicoides newsteadi TaxID=1961830 RepID=UPI000B9A2410|nr:RlmE family RNA methyltransferase [Rickettsia endosymbiont of Culicoides newsteadi]OZG31896.1 23S rRNA methyltransferase [Rickettsia endosymbiont of Culicoides newsteadi]